MSNDTGDTLVDYEDDVANRYPWLVSAPPKAVAPYGVVQQMAYRNVEGLVDDTRPGMPRFGYASGAPLPDAPPEFIRDADDI